MTFANSELLFLLLLLIPYIIWYVMFRKKKEPTLRVPDTQAYRYIPVSKKLYLIHVPFCLRLLTLTMIILVLARPQTQNHCPHKVSLIFRYLFHQYIPLKQFYT